ncbi:MAG: hypothetical protein M1832_005441 [Thelocarpon impressellum]|nr:MAG: hypothetical protein M1832_005441 [Thelocarpon impressellum]
MYSRAVSTAAVVAALAVSAADAISKISISGSKFFTDGGDQFFVKGVAYQLTPDDPLIDSKQCKLDASLMKDLGANSIRVYHVDPKGDHKGCMDAFSENGIYLFVDLDTFSTQISQEAAFWNQTQLSAFEAVLDEFVKYDNTAGVFVGNEVITRSNGSEAAPYVKAAARDVKAYRDSKGMRKVPVGYSAADIAELRPMLQDYLACGTNASESLDFFSLNAYEWCGPSSFVGSGYSELIKNASAYPIPIFFSETGCNTNRPRTFDDQAAIFGQQMTGVWSGAIVYEWIEEANNYGLISYGPKVDQSSATGALDGFPRSGTPTPVSPDFSNLKGQWATLTPSGVKKSEYSPTNGAPACPAETSGVWDVDGGAALPTLGQTAAKGASPTGAAGSGTSTGASPSATKQGAASGGKEVAGMSAALVAVLLGFVWWL